MDNARWLNGICSWGIAIILALFLCIEVSPLRGEDCGYDPEAPPAEREAAVHEILGAAKYS